MDPFSFQMNRDEKKNIFFFIINISIRFTETNRFCKFRVFNAFSDCITAKIKKSKCGLGFRKVTKLHSLLVAALSQRGEHKYMSVTVDVLMENQKEYCINQ